MKKSILLLLAIVFINIHLNAQSFRQSDIIHEIREELNLTEAQLNELVEIKTEMRTKLRERKDSDQQLSFEERKNFRDQYRDQMLAILTPEQIEKMEALKAAKRQSFHEAKEAKFHERSDYREKEVLPVLLKQRAKLDKEISDKDKKGIAKLRMIKANFKAEIKATHHAKKEANKNTDDLSNKRNRASHHKGFGKGKHKGFGMIKYFKEKYPEEAKQLEQLENKYSNDIIKLMDEIADERAEWKATKDAHRAAQKEKHKKKFRKDIKDAEFERKRKSNRAEMKEEHKILVEKLKRIDFLLMDPNLRLTENNNKSTSPKSTHNARVFPNPATHTQTLEFEVAKNGNVLVEIIDKKGKVIKEIHNSTMNIGIQSIDVDITQLKGYVFYYRITDGTGTSSTKFMTKK